MCDNNLNWQRPVRWIKVKRYSQPIAIDECCAEMVIKIDGLLNTQTTSCCCGHGVWNDGYVEFKSKLSKEKLIKRLDEIKLEKADWIKTKEKWVGWRIGIKCYCDKIIIDRAKKHFRGVENESIQNKTRQRNESIL